MSKKSKCYEDGGEVDFETKTGANQSIGNDVRARALAAMAKNNNESEESKYVKNLYNTDGESAESKYAKKLYSEEVVPKNELPETKKITRIDRKVSPKSKSVEIEKVATEKFSPAKTLGIDSSRFKKPPPGSMKAMGFKSGGKVSSASKRADGCAVRGKTKA